ncbi:hypothetical protein GCM10007878_01220 [Marinospirillum insulare]|uniref:Toxin CptA n=2 Tax=Marinospirillum insulare TaxID=217169 RepID=A0ABQ5ZTD8_9GAMM|nr:hypothetical protein GCM10007878_01220 [Marinospirillum insulare]
MAVWINIKVSKLGRIFFLLVYTGLIVVLLSHTSWLANGFIALLLLHAWWSWRQAFGVAAPVALLLKDKELYWQLARGQQQLLQPPAVLFSRFILVFKPAGPFAWPWLLWPDSLSPKEHHQLRCFLRTWH